MRIEKARQILPGQTSRDGNSRIENIDEVFTERKGRIGEVVLPAKNLATMEDIKAEAEFLSGMLTDPVDPVTTDQNELYAIFEKRITRLGLAMGKEAETRAEFRQQAFDAEISMPSDAYIQGCKNDAEAMENYKQASHAYIKAKYHAGANPNPEQMEEISRLKMEKESHEERGYEIHLDMERLQKEEDDRVAAVRMEVKRKMSAAYASVVADIRPVGGIVPSHQLSDQDALYMLNETVGKHYPSDWLKASAREGEMAVAPTSEGRAKYSAHQFYPSTPESGLEVQESFVGLVPAEKTEEFLEKISEDGIEIHGHGTSFDNGDGEYRFVEFAARHEFNPNKDQMGEDGIPEGPGWNFGYVPRTAPGGMHVPAEKVWYRVPVNYGKVVPTLFVASKDAGEEKQRATAYHEFSHRAEDTVRGGLIEHLEESFLVRRTTDENGEREELSAMKPGDGTLGGTELGRPGTFMMHYIGKEYLNHRSREVLAIGSESLFAGSYGSFMGLDGKHPVDLDHRGFTLGIFAVA
jgi:hypothetical protein